MSSQKFIINSSSNGQSIPNAGFLINKGSALSITGGSSIEATIQRRYKSGWQDVPNELSAISGPHEIVFEVSGTYRVSVTTATGEWYLEITN